jgi:hypothetical protein
MLRNRRSLLTTFLSYRDFKSEIDKSASVWPWNLGQRSNMNSFWIPWVWLPIPCQCYFFSLTPIVKKLLSIEFVIFHVLLVTRSFFWTNLRKDFLRDYETSFHLVLAFVVLEMKIFRDLAFLRFLALVWPLWRSKSNLKIIFFYMLQQSLIIKMYFLATTGTTGISEF